MLEFINSYQAKIPKSFCTFLLFLSLFACLRVEGNAQVRVEELIDLDASGGISAGPDGNIYISDFGKAFGNIDAPTKVYKWNPKTEELTIFADGFLGASGSCFDKEGNFYQSNNAGATVSKIHRNGEVVLDWCRDSSKIKTPIGLASDQMGNIYLANCGKNEIGKITPDGTYSTFAKSEDFNCPNGLTMDKSGNLYTCNFNDGKVLEINPDGRVSILTELPILSGGHKPVGNGHLVYSKGWLFTTTIGAGELYRIGLDGSKLKIRGRFNAFQNVGGDADKVSFSKPNGIAASSSGDTLYINVSEPSWKSNPRALHPGKVMMVRGILSLPAKNPGQK